MRKVIHSDVFIITENKMLKITSIDITDFGRHKRVTSAIAGSCVGLAGASGLGKSTVLQAIQFALTGTIDHEDQLKEFIRKSTGEDAPQAAEVTLEFTAGGKHGKISRRITRKSVSRKLWWDGCDKPITAEAQVAEIMFNILGVDKKAINSTVFIRQGDMARMFGGDVDRRDFYTRLLMLGHLAKVANVVDTYRTTTAASVQDLGVVMDAAQSSYDDAAKFYDACRAEYECTPTKGSQVRLARAVVGAYENQAEAERLLNDAQRLLHSYTRGEDTLVWIGDRQRKKEDLEESVRLMSERRDNHRDLAAQLSKLELEFVLLKDDTEKFNKKRSLEAAIKSFGDIGESPTNQVEKAETLLEKFRRLKCIAEEMQQLTLEVRETRQQYEQYSQALAALEELCNTARERYTTTRSELSMRESLMNSLDPALCQTDACPLCGSTEKPDPDRLNREIEALRVKLSAIERDGKESKLKCDAARQSHNDCDAKLRRLEYSVEKLTTEARRLTLETTLTSESKAAELLESSKAKVAAYQAQSMELYRLKKEYQDIESATKGKIEPHAALLDSTANLLQQTRKQSEDSKWAEEDQSKLMLLVESAQKLNRELKDTQARISEYASHLSRYNATCESLQTAIEALPAEVRGNETVLTHQTAQSILSDLELQQSRHDVARGKYDAANQALKAASARIAEIELRVTEQRQRMELVADLEKVRDAFKPTGVSLDYLDYKFGRIARLAADYLADSGADFMVVPSQAHPMSFDFMRTDRADEVWMPQSRMSGGQKVRLAVATLLAIHEIVIPDVGLLVLDEPTTHLHEDAISSMAEMFKKISDQGNLQLIVCDHSPTLIDAFSDKIEIKH